jgi:ComF family protein
VACGEWLLTPSSGPVCADCWRAVALFIPPLCDVCGAPVSQSSRVDVRPRGCGLCALEPLAWVSRARALGPYEGALRAILHGLKFRRCPTLAAPLAGWVRDQHGDLLAGADAVVPVPLHSSRQRRRGFNQARELAAHLELPVMPLLRRARRTPQQTSLPAAARRANLEAAFTLSRRYEWFGRTSIRGRRLVLVDDVWTTGATLSACARALHEAGAAEIRALAVARTLPVGWRPLNATATPAVSHGVPGLAGREFEPAPRDRSRTADRSTVPDAPGRPA